MRPLLQTESRRQSVCLSVCLSVSHTSEPCKKAEPIEMPFGLRTRESPGYHVLDGCPDPPWEGAISEGGGVAHYEV